MTERCRLREIKNEVNVPAMIFSKTAISRRSLIALLGAAAGSAFLPARAGVKTVDATRDRSSSTLFYKPRRTGNIWDAWIYYHAGTFYLYYNPSPSEMKTFGGWNCIALATSQDGVHWHEHGIVQNASRGTQLGSGAVWPMTPSADAPKFIMNFSEQSVDPSDRKAKQIIFFAESNNLIHWRRLDAKYSFQSDPRWYDPSGRWDNIWPVPRPDGGYYGYWAATPNNKKVGIGLGESSDGVNWTALPPALLPEISLGPTGAYSPEVGAVHLHEGKYYALVGLNGTEPIVNEGMSVFRPGETIVIADSPRGPFRVCKKNSRLLVGNASYFTRFLDTPGGTLGNHQSWEHDPSKSLGVDPDRVYMAPLKRAHWDNEGTLRLMWWDRNDSAKGQSMALSLGEPSGTQPVFFKTVFDLDKTMILEGQMRLPASSERRHVGLYFQGAGNTGTAFLVLDNGRVDYGSMRENGTGFQRIDSVDRSLAPEITVRFRLVRKGRMTECYLNDFLMQCYSLPEGTGQVGLLGPPSAYDKLKVSYCL